MKITNKVEHDPTADLYTVDAYMRWALLAAEEVMGKNGLNVLLRDCGLAELVDNYPPNELKATGNLNFGHYASFSAGVLNFYGRAGKGMVMRIGKLSAKHAIEQQAGVFNLAALLASKLLPTSVQLKMGLETQINGMRKLSQAVGQDIRLSLEDRGDKLAYVAQDCASCAGKQSTDPMCYLFTGVLEEAFRWQMGKEFEIAEVECRATGGHACVWEISKKAKS